MRWRLTWGVRRTELEEDGTISTRQPKELKPPADLTSGRHIRKHTIFHVYNNKEDARRAMELRKEKTKQLPKPLVNILAEEARGSNQ
ncbi:hypothetical protein FRC15_010901 [Serendipita sp. 397]|nr:hypothetical protein FRC15_010901 [Serendipita sp. 397]